MTSQSDSYLLASASTELERLQLQSRVWEPAGRALLSRYPAGAGATALDVGCGVLGWLRLLSEWVGPEGSVVGSDLDEKMLAAARTFLEAERITNVRLERDNLFDSRLPTRSFDLVHSRFQITPLGRGEEQVAIYRNLVRPGGLLVLEDPEGGSWQVNPDASACARLIDLVYEAFAAAGGNFHAGRSLPSLLRGVGLEPTIEARVVALGPGHPYLYLPLQFAAALRPRLEAAIGRTALDDLLERTEEELRRPDVWGTTFTLIQTVARVPS